MIQENNGNQVIGSLEGCEINWRGKNSIINVGKGFSAKGLCIDVFSNTSISIGDNVTIRGKGLWRFYDNAKCTIGNDTSWQQEGFEVIVRKNAVMCIGNGVNFNKNDLLVVHDNTTLKIGNDCLFARDVVVRTDDGHPIYDIDTGKRINPGGQSIEIGEHVWVGQEVTILYPSVIGDGTVIGARGFIKGKYPNNCIIVGQADKVRVIRKNIAWKKWDDGGGIEEIPERYRKKTEEII